MDALIIKHFKQLSYEETIQEIQENPYLQYFLGYSSYQFKPGFDSSLFVTIRSRLPAPAIEAINEIIAVIWSNMEFDSSDEPGLKKPVKTG